MKTLVLPKKHESGNVLLVCLVTAMIIGLTLASYLIMTQNQNVSVTRSQLWNTSMTLTEAGVEDALAFINKYNGDIVRFPTWTNSASVSADNWTTVGPNVYVMHRVVDSKMGYYDVYVTNRFTAGVNTPSIYSVGTAYWVHSYASAPQTFFALAGTPDSTAPSPLVRRVLVQTRIDPMFAVAMAAKNTIDLNGKDVATDSFDSADPNYSENGLYPEGSVNKTKDNGDVVTDGTVINSLNVGNAKIKGKVKTGPNGTISIGPDGSVGDRAWVEGGSTGIQTNHSANDMNVLFPDVSLPSVPWQSPTGGTVDGTNYDFILGTGNYTLENCGKFFDRRILVTGNAVLYVPGTVNMTGKSYMLINTNASLKIYSGGTVSVGGNGVINGSGNAANFYVLGLPTCTSVSFGGNADYTGVVYAPEADFQLGGGGNDDYDFVGSSITRTVRMNGHFHFHYDENLRRVGPGRGYIPTSWTEL